VRIVVVVVTLAACSTSPSHVVATLEEVVASVERMPRADAAWHVARKGDTFVNGSAVRTGVASRAKLRVGKAGRLDVRPSSIVYFTRDGQKQRDDVKVETGSVEIEAGDASLGLGEAVLEPGAKVRVDSAADGTTIVVTLGRVVLEDNVIEAGKSVTLSTAGARPAVTTPTPIDAGEATTRAGITVAIAGKAATAKSKAGESELGVGEHAVEVGTSIVTPEGAVATIARGGATVATAGPSEVRILDRLAIISGAATLQAESADAVATIPGGTVTARTGGAATATVGKAGTQITAQRGTVEIETARGTETLAPGETATVTAKGAIERLPPPPKQTVATIEAGESPMLHDARAPTALRVRFGAACTGAGIVEVAKDRAFKRIVARSGGSDGANVLVPAGTFSYRVRCPHGKGASGTVRVAKDAGTRPLPKAAARTFVDLDGREYTILYQNLLPELSLSWRNAPTSLRYTFVIKPASGAEKRITSMTSATTLPAGELREGSYTAWAELDGGRKSEVGRIVIEFDNAAPSVSIDRVAAEGDGTRVSGTVIEGTTVSVTGTPVELDRHRRFTAVLPARDTDEAPAVRIAHPKSGLHYYVVRDAARR